MPRDQRSSPARTALLPFHRLIVLLAATALLPGCRVWHGFDPPPNRVGEHGPAVRDPGGRRAVVLDELEPPDTSPIPMQDIGRGMTARLAETMLNHGTFDVTIDEDLATKARAILEKPHPERAPELEKLRETRPGVRFIVTGKVTDFTRTRDKPKETHEKRLFRLPKAVVAIRLYVIDLEEGRVVSHDHVMGEAWDYSWTDTEKVYSKLSFDEYLFWTTSVGHAAHDATVAAVEVIDRLVPTRDDSVQIVAIEGPRRLRLAGGSNTTFVDGDIYYVFAVDRRTDRARPVYDRSTGRPLIVVVTEDSRVTSVGYLRGEAPLGVDLRGAILTTNRPPRRDEPDGGAWISVPPDARSGASPSGDDTGALWGE